MLVLHDIDHTLHQLSLYTGEDTILEKWTGVPAWSKSQVASYPSCPFPKFNGVWAPTECVVGLSGPLSEMTLPRCSKWKCVNLGPERKSWEKSPRGPRLRSRNRGTSNQKRGANAILDKGTARLINEQCDHDRANTLNIHEESTPQTSAKSSLSSMHQSSMLLWNIAKAPTLRVPLLPPEHTLRFPKWLSQILKCQKLNALGPGHG